MRYKWKPNGEFLVGSCGFVIGVWMADEIRKRAITSTYESPRTCVMLCGAIVQVCLNTRQAKAHVASFIEQCAAAHARVTREDDHGA